jgi:hypothetical protein
MAAAPHGMNPVKDIEMAGGSVLANNTLKTSGQQQRAKRLSIMMKARRNSATNAPANPKEVHGETKN